MRKGLFLSIFVLCSAPAFASDPAQCDATAFTLARPSTPAPKAEKSPPVVKTAATQAAPKDATTKPKAKTTSRLLSTCDEGKKKHG